MRNSLCLFLAAMSFSPSVMAMAMEWPRIDDQGPTPPQTFAVSPGAAPASAPAPAPVPVPAAAPIKPPASGAEKPPQPQQGAGKVETRIYYYCDNPAGYYPTVSHCVAPWRQVIERTTNEPVPPPPKPQLSPRDADYKELNTLADEFHRINAKDPRAQAKLRALSKKVEQFRKSLFERDYNAMTVLKDTEDLKSRIIKKRAELAAKKR